MYVYPYSASVLKEAADRDPEGGCVEGRTQTLEFSMVSVLGLPLIALQLWQSCYSFSLSLSICKVDMRI